MKYETLGIEERKLLLQALDIDFNNLKCYHCCENVDFEDCCIMHPLKNEKKKATILCNSPLCISMYLTEIEDEEEMKKEGETCGNV